MIAPWLVATLAAALVQTGRFALQKRLKSSGLAAGGATFARFVFAAPLAVVLAAGLVTARGEALAMPPGRFWIAVAGGGLAQVLATMTTVALFSLRNFAAGIAFTKTETVLVALFSAVVLGEAVSGAGFAAILVGLAGVLLLSLPTGEAGAVRRGWRAPLLGLAAGTLFGISAIGYRAATLALPSGDTLERAVVTLAAVTCFQTLAMLPWLEWRDPGEVRRVLTRWRITALVGVSGMLGSLGWFIAFTLQNAAYVRAVGQVELVFSALVSWLVFRERASGRELAGIGLLGVSIVLLVLLAA